MAALHAFRAAAQDQPASTHDEGAVTLITTVLITVQTLVPAQRVTEAFGLNTASTGAGYALAGAALATLPLQVTDSYPGVRAVW